MSHESKRFKRIWRCGAEHKKKYSSDVCAKYVLWFSQAEMHVVTHHAFVQVVQ